MEKDELRNIMRDALGPVVAADMQAVIQENDGLRASLKAMMKGEDGMVPIHHIMQELTPQGVREFSLRQAGVTLQVIGNIDQVGFTPELVLETARKYEAFINGTEKPQDEVKSDED